MEDDSYIHAMEGMQAIDNMENMESMDNIDNMDDLFIDTQAALQQNAAIDKALLQRLDEFRISGCCRKIAWSKIGAVAHISENGEGVKVTPFVQDGAHTGFELMEGAFLDLPDDVSFPLTSVTWSVAGNELAVTDSAGKILMFSTLVALNVLSRVFFPDNHDQPDALNVIVGLDWLCPNRNWAIYASASHGENGWSYTPAPQKPKGPTHPLPNKSAMMVVTRGGTLRLLYQSYAENDKTFYDLRTQLVVADSTENFLTHASIALEPDSSVLLVTCDYSSTMRVYRVKINWNYDSQNGPSQIAAKSGHIEPTLELLRLKELRNISTQNSVLLNNPSQQLTHLQMLPSTMEPTSKRPIPASVIAVFTMTDSSLALPTSPRSKSSRVARWELQEDQEKLHPSFESLSTTKKPNSNALSKNHYDMKRMDDFDLPSIVLLVTLFRINTIVAFSMSDGRIEFRDRPNLQPIEMTEGASPKYLSTLVNVGFTFSPTNPCIDMAMSPNYCMAATKEPGDKVTLRSMEHQSILDPSIAISPDAVTAAIALVFATSCVQLHTNDDLLSVIQKHMYMLGVHDLLEAMIVATNVSLDFTESPEKLVRSPLVLRCLNMQCAIGQQQDSRTLSSKIAWIMMNLRASYWTWHVGLNTASSGSESARIPVDSQSDLPSSLLGVTAWFFDLMVMMTNELMSISHNVQGKEGDREAVQTEVIKLHSSCLCMLLGAVSRIYFRANCRYIRTLADRGRKLAENYGNRDARGWSTFVSLVNSSPVNAFAFEQALAEIDHHVKTTFDKAGYEEPQRNATERRMLVTGELPEVLMPVVQRLLTTTLNKLLDEIDPVEVYCKDVSWLGITDDSATDNGGIEGAELRRPRKRRRCDVHRKVPLIGIKKLRRCTRCGSLMEHFMPRGQTAWILLAQKSCVCGNFWVVEDI